MDCVNCKNSKSWLQTAASSSGERIGYRSFDLCGGVFVEKKSDWLPIEDDFPIKDPEIPAIYCGNKNCNAVQKTPLAEKWLNSPKLIPGPIEPFWLIKPENVDLERILERLKEDFGDEIVKIVESDPPREAQRIDIETLRKQKLLEESTLSVLDNIIPSGSGLYTHQVKAIRLLKQGKNVIIATNTASGKSLCFQTILLNKAAEAYKKDLPKPSALYFSPLNALIDDQFRSFGNFCPAPEENFDKNQKKLREKTFFQKLQLPNGAELSMIQYHGGVKGANESETREIRRNLRAQNPDMVFASPELVSMAILPNSIPGTIPGGGEKPFMDYNWGDFIKRLQVLVIDECHEFRGVLGAHVANIIRRIRRLRAKLGNNSPLQCILLSATVKQPHEFGRRLLALEENCFPDVISSADDTSERHPKKLVFLKLPEAEPDLKKQASKLLIHLFAKEGLREIAFQESIPAVESLGLDINKWGESQGLNSKVTASYCSPYPADKKAETLKSLRDGETGLVVSTSALALGVDIGKLAASILITYPGRISKAWQMLGRAGRKGPGLQIFLGGMNFLDQYWLNNPEAFKNREQQMEDMIINHNNHYVLRRHIMAANYDLPIDLESDQDFFGKEFNTVIQQLQKEDWGLNYDETKNSGRLLFRKPDDNSIIEISLRGVGKVPVYELGSMQKGQEPFRLMEVDYFKAFKNFHPGAIFIHDRKFWRVIALRFDNSKEEASERKSLHILVAPLTMDDRVSIPCPVTTINICSEPQPDEQIAAYNVQKFVGQLDISTQVNEYKLIPYKQSVFEEYPDLENEATGQFATIENPDETDDSDVLSERLSQVIKCYVNNRPPDSPIAYQYNAEGCWLIFPERVTQDFPEEKLGNILFTIGKAILKAIPIFHYASPEDLSFSVGEILHEERNKKVIFIHENQPGNMGLANMTYQKIDELISLAYYRVLKDCPGCSHDPESQGCPVCVADISEQHRRVDAMEFLKELITNQPGSIDPYEILQNFGYTEIVESIEGGFGTVFFCQATAKARGNPPIGPVAVKFMHKKKLKYAEESVLEGLLMQTLNERGLGSENLISCYHVEHIGQQVMTVMEQANQGSLFQRMKNQGIPYKPVNKEHNGNEVSRYLGVLLDFKEIAQGVAHLHNHPENIVHCDLKPRNILLHNGTFKVADLGAARKVDTPVFAFSPMYAPEEQRKANSQAKKTMDVYALGKIFEQMVGEYEFPSQDGQDSNPSLPTCIIEIKEKCLKSDPEQRFKDAQALLESIKNSINEITGVDYE